MQRMDSLASPEAASSHGNLGLCLVSKTKISKKKFRHLYGDLNLDKIKNVLRLLSVNGETNLMNLIML